MSAARRGAGITNPRLDANHTRSETQLGDDAGDDFDFWAHGVGIGLAHGYPFDGFPNGGLLELVRDLIDFAYREWSST
jgi:hypothetical protein